MFLQPTLLLNVPDDHPCVLEEIFGPVTVIRKWSDYEEVMALANSTHYGWPPRFGPAIWAGRLMRRRGLMRGMCRSIRT